MVGVGFHAGVPYSGNNAVYDCAAEISMRFGVVSGVPLGLRRGFGGRGDTLKGSASGEARGAGVPLPRRGTPCRGIVPNHARALRGPAATP